MNASRTLLAIRLRQLGDVLATLGTLRAIKKAAPTMRIVFIVDAHYHGLLAKVPYVDRLLPQPPPFRGLAGTNGYVRYIEQLRDMNIDYTLDFHSNTRSSLLAYFSGAAVRVGFDVRVRKLLYTDIEPRAVFRNGQTLPRTSHESALALAARIGIDGLEGSVVGTIPVDEASVAERRRAMAGVGIPMETAQPRVVGLNPGNPYPAKAWPDEDFIELARALSRREITVVVVWGPGERDRAEHIAASVGRGVFAAPATDLEGLPGLLRNLSMLVTIDSGLKHLAVAVNVPTVSLFGPTNPREWHMGGAFDRLLYRDLSCSPCRLLECPFGSPCMTRITPESVLREVERVWNEVSAA